MDDLYYTEVAKDYRRKLQDIFNQCAELQYKLHNLQKQGNEIAKEYEVYLGLKEKDPEVPLEGGSNVKES